MPNNRFHDRVKDTTATTGTGPFTVSGTPPAGYQTFSARFAVGDNFYCVIAGQTGSEWQTGYATYTASNQVTFDKVEQSSNADNAVTFSAGTKDIFVDIIADRVNECPTLSRVMASQLNLGTL
jgi:hypothetical protein